MHENLVSFENKDKWFTIWVQGQKVDLYIQGKFYDTIINDALITLGNVYPIVTFGAADGDQIKVLPVDKETPPAAS